MGFFLPAKNTASGAPEVADGLALARFDDIQERFVEEFVTDSDKFKKADDGKRLDFVMTLVDEDHDVIYQEGDPIVLRQAKSVKPGATGEKSNFYEYLSGLLTAKQLAQWEASTEDDPADFSELPGTVYNVKISHSKSGWPQIETIIGPAKAPKK